MREWVQHCPACDAMTPHSRRSYSARLATLIVVALLLGVVLHPFVTAILGLPLIGVALIGLQDPECERCRGKLWARHHPMRKTPDGRRRRRLPLGPEWIIDII